MYIVKSEFFYKKDNICTFWQPHINKSFDDLESARAYYESVKSEIGYLDDNEVFEELELFRNIDGLELISNYRKFKFEEE